MVLLQTLDHLWREHLITLEHLRQVIGFRSYGQRDPLNEYKSEGFHLFETMLTNLREAVTGQLMHIQGVPEEEPAVLEPVELPPMRAQHIDPFTGEDELAMAEAALAAEVHPGIRDERRTPASHPQEGKRAQSQESRHLGQGGSQRALSLRFGQKI